MLGADPITVRGAKRPEANGLDPSFERYLRREFAGGGSKCDFHPGEDHVDTAAGKGLADPRPPVAFLGFLKEAFRNPRRTKPARATVRV